MNLLLDANMDLSFVDGKIQTVADAAETVQRLRMLFAVQLREWFLDQGFGFPYRADEDRLGLALFVHHPDLPALEALARGLIAEVEGVKRVLSFSLTLDDPASERLARIAFRVLDVTGRELGAELTI